MHRDSAAMKPEALLDGADVGNAKFKWLDSTAARAYAARHSPRQVTVGGIAEDSGLPHLVYTPYSCCRTRTGYHAVCCVTPRSKSEFAKFGAAVGASFCAAPRQGVRGL